MSSFGNITGCLVIGAMNPSWIPGDELLSLSLLFPGSQLDFWKLLMSKALEGPGSVADQEFSTLLEKPLGSAVSQGFLNGSLCWSLCCEPMRVWSWEILVVWAFVVGVFFLISTWDD